MRSRRKGNIAFTLLELLITVALIAIVAALLLPAFKSGLEASRSAACIRNLGTLGSALNLYLGDNNNVLFPLDKSAGGKSWAMYLLPYTEGSQKVFRCPGDKTDPSKIERTYRFNVTRGGGYGSFGNEYSMFGKSITAFTQPSETVAIVDNTYFPSPPARIPFASNSNILWWADLDTDEARQLGNHGPNKANLLFLDGHVQSVTTPVPLAFYDYLKNKN